MSDEDQLRKALGAVNNLEPPQDDLFVQRAISRGRSRANRRRPALLGAAAAAVVVAATATGYFAMNRGGEVTTADAGSAPSQVENRAVAEGPSRQGDAAQPPLAPAPAATVLASPSPSTSPVPTRNTELLVPPDLQTAIGLKSRIEADRNFWFSKGIRITGIDVDPGTRKVRIRLETMNPAALPDNKLLDDRYGKGVAIFAVQFATDAPRPAGSPTTPPPAR